MKIPVKIVGKKIPFFRVNLLLKQEEGNKLYFRFIKWILASGRYLVIVVELLTISAFVFRYKLDSDLIDLQEQINQQKPVIESFKEDEFKIRQTQFQLANTKKISSDNPDFAGILRKISALIPQTIKLTSISLDREDSYPKTIMTISGQTGSTSDLSYFVKSLQSDQAFSEIGLTNIAFDNQITFTITGSLNQGGGKNN